MLINSSCYKFNRNEYDCVMIKKHNFVIKYKNDIDAMNDMMYMKFIDDSVLNIDEDDRWFCSRCCCCCCWDDDDGMIVVPNENDRSIQDEYNDCKK